jgi:hypothetical protein
MPPVGAHPQVQGKALKRMTQATYRSIAPTP